MIADPPSGQPGDAPPASASGAAVAPRGSLRLSEILDRLARPGTGTVSLGDLLEAVEERSFGALLFLLAVPNILVAVVPGLAVVLGLPLMLLSLQLLVAAPRPWLPPRLARLRIRRADLLRVTTRLGPPLRRLERMLGARWLFLTAPWAERLAGAACLGLSLLVFVPMPLSNALPATGIALYGLALLERDGRVALAALLVTLACAALFGGAALALLGATLHLLAD